MMNKSKKYYLDCKCGEELQFETSQPTGAKEPLICGECYKLHLPEIPDRDENHLYTYQDNILQLRKHILATFASYQETMTVRQMFYRLLNKGYEKSEKFYNKVQRQMLQMRLSGALPFHFVADNTRSCYKVKSHNSLRDMLEESKFLYRRSLWDTVNVSVEIWLEKEALRGVFWPITRQYDVPLFITRGFSSVSFVQEASLEIKNRDHLTFVYLFTDHDPSGLKVAESIEKRMKEFGADGKAVFTRACLIPEQIEQYNLPSRPTKKSNHSKDWKGESVELDALEPKTLRSIVEGCITKHLDDGKLRRIQQIEKAEKDTLDTVINNLGYA